jgi:hypothetical protein
MHFEQRGRSRGERYVDGTGRYPGMLHAPVDQAGARHSLSPIVADGGAVMTYIAPSAAGDTGQYRSHFKRLMLGKLRVPSSGRLGRVRHSARAR